MTVPRTGQAERPETRDGKRRYEKPRLVDYGPVSKLTQSGSQTTHDNGNMFRQCL